MRSAIKPWLQILCCLSVLTGTQRASAGDKQLDLEPPATVTDYGYGYNSISRTHTMKSCVTFGAARIDGGESGDDGHYSSVTTNNQLANEMGLSVSAKFSMSMGVASMSTSAKVKFFNDTKTNVMTQTILASWHGVDAMNYIGGDIKLKPEYLKLVGTPAFREKCGDYFVNGMQKGRWLYGTVQLTVKDTTTQSELAASGAVGAEGGGASAEVGVGTLEKMKASSASEDLKIRVITSGSNSMALNIDAFMKKVDKFPNEDGPKETYKIRAVPYESVANWPTTADPLAPLTAADKLAIVAEAAWGLIALTDDADFITQHADLFALGTTPTKRAARTTYIKNRRKLYQAELESMRNSAKNCDVDWNSSPTCEALFNKWKTWVDFAVAEYSNIMPIRYASNCSKVRDVTLAGVSIADTLNPAVATQGNFGNSKGDREIEEFPLGVRAYLDFKPNFTGGDAGAATKLLATLSMSVSENSGDKSTFTQEVPVDVADLSLGDLSDGAPVSLDQCSYAGSGVKADLVTSDPAACDKMFKGLGVSTAAFAPLISACKAEAVKQKHHGILRAQVREWSGDVHTEPLKGGSGVLTSMKCMFNLSGDNHNVSCSNIGLKAVQFNLVNKEDVAADKWVAPPPTLNPRAKAIVKSVYASVVGKAVAPKPMVKPVVKPATAPVRRLVRPR